MMTSVTGEKATRNVVSGKENKKPLLSQFLEPAEPNATAEGSNNAMQPEIVRFITFTVVIASKIDRFQYIPVQEVVVWLH